MEGFIPLVVLDLSTLLVDTCKIYLQNRRLMAFIAVLVISLHTILYLSGFFSVKPLLTDLIIKQSYLLVTSPDTPEFTNIFKGILKDIKILIGLEWTFLLISTIASLFFAILTTHASALIHSGGKNLSIKDLVVKTVRSWKRPLVTCFYITLLSLGYIFLCLAFLFRVALTLGIHQLIFILLSISATVLYTYLSVFKSLSLVISILEERLGLEALANAAQIVKGMKLQGFILSLLLTLLSPILLHGLTLFSFTQSEAMRSVIALLEVNLIGMVQMFGYAAYTVFYYNCKKTHREEVELAVETEYTKMLTAPLITEAYGIC